MPDTKMTNAELVELYAGLEALLSLGAPCEHCGHANVVPDLDTMFAMRVSHMISELKPKVEAYERLVGKLNDEHTQRDAEGRKIPVKDGKGQATGRYRIDPELQEQFRDKRKELLDHVVKLRLPRIKTSELHRMSEEEGIPVPGRLFVALGPVLAQDLKPDWEEEPEGAGEEGSQPKKPSRSSRRKTAAAKV